jgi:hypothetical protein
LQGNIRENTIKSPPLIKRFPLSSSGRGPPSVPNLLPISGGDLLEFFIPVLESRMEKEWASEECWSEGLLGSEVALISIRKRLGLRM